MSCISWGELTWELTCFSSHPAHAHHGYFPHLLSKPQGGDSCFRAWGLPSPGQLRADHHHKEDPNAGHEGPPIQAPQHVGGRGAAGIDPSEVATLHPLPTTRPSANARILRGQSRVPPKTGVPKSCALSAEGPTLPEGRALLEKWSTAG